MKIHTVKYNFIMNIILKTAVVFFPILTFPYVSRTLLAVGNGKVAFATSLISYFSLLSSLGIPTYGVKACAQVRDNKEKLSKTVHELLIITAVSTVLSYILFTVMMFTIKELKDERTLLWISSLSIILNSMGVEWFYQAIEQYDYITYKSIGFKIISVILMFAFVHTPEDYVLYGGIMVLGTVGSNILNIIRLRNYISFKRLNEYNLRQHIRPVFLLFLYSAATTIYTNLDIVMLGFMAGDTQVGYYSVAIKIKNILASIVTALGSVLLPRVSYFLNNKMYVEFLEIIRDSLSFIFIISFPLLIFFFAESDEIIMFLAGVDYISAIRVLKAVIPTLFFVGIGSITAWQLLIPMGKEKYTVWGALVGGFVDIVLNVILIPKYGAVGAAIGTVAAEISVVIVHFLALKDTIKLVMDWRELRKSVMGSVIAYIILLGVQTMCRIENVLGRLMFSAVIFFIFYFLILAGLKETLIYKGINTLKKG